MGGRIDAPPPPCFIVTQLPLFTWFDIIQGHKKYHQCGMAYLVNLTAELRCIQCPRADMALDASKFSCLFPRIFQAMAIQPPSIANTILYLREDQPRARDAPLGRPRPPALPPSLLSWFYDLTFKVRGFRV